MLQAKMRRGRPMKLKALLVLGVVAAAGCGASTNTQSTFEPHGKIARDDKNIFMGFFWVAAVIGVLICLAVVFAAIRFRERPGNENPKQIHGHTQLEIAWTILPALILTVMGVFTVSMIWDQAAKPAGAMEITVTGKQWWWQFQYTKVDGQTKQVVTANELHIPAGKPIWLTLKSDNVNHSFWIPALAGKKDNIDGHLNNIQMIADIDLLKQPESKRWFDGQCAQYCGLSHADMRVKAKVDTDDEFKTWYASQLTSWTSDAVAKFKKWDDIYTCSSCHYIQGLAKDNTDAKVQSGEAPVPINRGPNLTHLADRTSFAGAKYALTLDNLTQWIYDAQAHSAGEFGKPMECPNYQKDKVLCVGMPAFKDWPGHKMTMAEAKEIAQFLLDQKST